MTMPSPTQVPAERFRLTSSDGTCIACARWDSSGPARAVVQIAHGRGEHMGRYADTVDALVAAGLIVYANDHRGHGLSAHARLGELGKGGFELLVQDMVRLSEIAREDNPDLPLLLLGHDMGSFAAQRYVIDHSQEIDGLILSGSGALEGLARAAFLETPGSNLLNAAFEPARTRFDWLCRDQSIVDAFMADPLCFEDLHPDSLASFLGTAPQLYDPVALSKIRGDLPIYLFSGRRGPRRATIAGPPQADWPLSRCRTARHHLRFLSGRSTRDVERDQPTPGPNPPARLDFPDPGKTERQ
jgi:alpha-beta hydrolase superfamily lysophospholipase